MDSGYGKGLARTTLPDPEDSDVKPRCEGPPTAGQLKHAAKYGKPTPDVCGRLLAELVTRPWAIRCGKCKYNNAAS